MSAQRLACRTLFVICLWQGVAAGDDLPKRQPPRFTVSKETTHFVSPLDKEGYVDFVAAVNEHFGRGVTPKNNANALYWRATGPMSEGAPVSPDLFKLLGIDPLPEKGGDYYLHLGSYLDKHAKIAAADPRYAPILNEFQEHAQARPWHEAQFPHIGSWLTFNAAPLATIVEGAKRPAYFAPIYHPRDLEDPEPLTGALLLGLSIRRDLLRALVARAMLHLGEGRPHAAWQDLQACHRLACHVGRGPWLLESVLGVAMDGMASSADVVFLKHTELTAAQAATCLDDLRALAPSPGITEKVAVTERVLFLDTAQMLARRGKYGFEVFLPKFEGESPPDWVRALDPATIDWDETFKTGNQWFDRCAEALRIEDHQKRVKAVEELEARLQELAAEAPTAGPTTAPPAAPAARDAQARDAQARKTVSQRLAGYLMRLTRGALPGVIGSEMRGRQMRANTQIAFALAAHRAAEGRYPSKLAELSPRYFKQLPQDLFTGRELVYSASDNSYLLYSVGPNGKDENGASFRDMPAGDDIAVRVPF